MKCIKSQTMRFFIAGVANTVLTYLIYLALLPLLAYVLAFTVTFVIGIIFSFFMNSLYVFNSPLGLSGLIKYPGVYFAQYLLGLVLLGVLIDCLGVDERFAPVC